MKLKNIEFKLKDDGKTLLMKVDLSEDNGPSKSGKTRIIASSEGNVPLPVTGMEHIKIGLNIYK